MEDLGYGGVHLNEEVALLDDAIVSCFDGLVDPMFELLTTDGVEHIDHVLPGQPIDVELVLGEVLERRAFFAFSSELHHLLDAEAIVVGHVEVLGLLSWDSKSLSTNKVPEVPDGDLAIFGQVRLALGGEEVEDLWEEW